MGPTRFLVTDAHHAVRERFLWRCDAGCTRQRGCGLARLEGREVFPRRRGVRGRGRRSRHGRRAAGIVVGKASVFAPEGCAVAGTHAGVRGGDRRGDGVAHRSAAHSIRCGRFALNQLCGRGLSWSGYIGRRGRQRGDDLYVEEILRLSVMTRVWVFEHREEHV